jgi:hypothetical protein
MITMLIHRSRYLSSLPSGGSIPSNLPFPSNDVAVPSYAWLWIEPLWSDLARLVLHLIYITHTSSSQICILSYNWHE